ncbi:MAG: DUF362 domain-containing protein [Spirochaetia bacterium]|nr:DUF362 domain-containing protein [Spirochaetia bacterium]
MASVAILKCPDYGEEKVVQITNKLLDSIHLDQVKDKKILLKPNILYAAQPSKAVTTHPAVLKAVIRYLQKNGNTIFVGDSPAFQNQEAAASKAGLKQVTDECGATWQDFTQTAAILSPEGKLVKSFQLASILNGVDIVISLPKMKTHSLMYYTGAMKNLFGLVPGLSKSALHLRFPDRDNFAQMIVDLNLAAKPSYAIMDAIVGMEGPGPGSGSPRNVGLLLASDNVLALDLAAARIMGYKAETLPILSQALECGHWLKPGEEVIYPLEKAEELLINDYRLIWHLHDASMFRDYMPEWAFRLVKNLTVKRPIFNPKKCKLCGECVRICPAKALSIAGNKVQADYKKCIRCYCCHEICNHNAITLKKKVF